jgi:flagellar hook-associated protein 1 FlgK
MTIAYNIAINGLRAAQQAIELIGTNISYAGAEGYHRQELRLAPMERFVLRDNIEMQGPLIRDIARMMDSLLETEIYRQQPIMAQLEKELSTLETVESTLGEVNSEGIGTGLNNFFNALTALSTAPDNPAYQNTVVWNADALVSQFHNLSTFLTDLDEHIRLEADAVVVEVNNLVQEIAELNREIQTIALRGANTNMLEDQRDQAATELARLVDADIEIYDTALGLANVTAWGTALVLGTDYTELEVEQVDGDKLGISIKDANYFRTDFRGGKLGGLLELKNVLISDTRDRLDLLAKQIIDQVNEIHVAGVGPGGAFTDLSGTTVPSTTLDEWDATIQAGSFYIRQTDSGGTITVHEVTVDPAADTATTIAAKIDALDADLEAEVASSRLRIWGLNGDKFDFVPGMTLTNGLGGSAVPSAEGRFTGSTTDTFTCKIIGTGDVGVTGNLRLEVRDGAAQLVTSIDIGEGYEPGKMTELGNETGIRIAISAGSVVDAETFTIEAIADSDETGFLAAAGMNTFFSGRTATNIEVRDDIKSDPTRLATSLSDGSGNDNALRLADLQETSISALGDMSFADYHRRTVLTIGQGVAARKARQMSMDKVLQQLKNQWDRVSGVDINEEAAKLLAFERMYQAVARFISAQNQSLQYLMDSV